MQNARRHFGFRSPSSFHSHGSLHHIFVAQNAAHFFIAPQKRHIQPERYAQLALTKIN
jgi:hypothetical protein